MDISKYLTPASKATWATACQTLLVSMAGCDQGGLLAPAPEAMLYNSHRIHGAAILMVTWIPSIYPSHVSIYTIHGSYGINCRIVFQNGSNILPLNIWEMCLVVCCSPTTSWQVDLYALVAHLVNPSNPQIVWLTRWLDCLISENHHSVLLFEGMEIRIVVKSSQFEWVEDHFKSCLQYHIKFIQIQALLHDDWIILKSLVNPLFSSIFCLLTLLFSAC